MQNSNQNYGLRPARLLGFIALPLLASLPLATAAPATPAEKLATIAPNKYGRELRDALVREAARPGKPAWQPMLLYLAELHGRSINLPTAHFKYPWEDIGPGYRYPWTDIGAEYQGARVFGHWDLTHEKLDTVRALPKHARNQIRNELSGQQKDGLIPGLIVVSDKGHAAWKDFKGYPPLWPVSVDAYVQQTGDVKFLNECLDALRRQIGWFENKRALADGGFYYLDVLQNTWESGVDEGIRFDIRPEKPGAAVDACSHLYLAYDHAARWSKRLGQPSGEWEDKARKLKELIQTRLWDSKTGFFYDSWALSRSDDRPLAFEGLWPLMVGAATPEQAQRVIDEHLLNPKEFFTPHPISTVALADPKFEIRMWRGPVWNDMTYWAARGCLIYGRKEAAHLLLEKSLDATATQFQRTGTLWEFYHPLLGEQKKVLRKAKGSPIPFDNYVGHNPLFAMVDLWRKSAPNSK